MVFQPRTSSNTVEHRPWGVIFNAMHALRDAGVTSKDAYAVLKVEALTVSTDENGDAVIPDSTTPARDYTGAGASQSGRFSADEGAGA